MILVIGPTPRNATSALIPVRRDEIENLDKRTTLYVRTDVAVVLTPCFCGAGYNELCIGGSGKRMTVTHVDRRLAAHKTRSTLGLDEELRLAWLLMEDKDADRTREVRQGMSRRSPRDRSAVRRPRRSRRKAR